MASIKLTLDTRNARKDGTFPLKIGVSHNRYFQISLDVHLLPEQWIDGEIVLPKERSAEAKRLNEYVRGRLDYAQNALRRLAMLGELKALSDKELKRQLDTNAKEEKAPERPVALVADRFRSFIDRRNKPGTAGLYRETLKKIGKYHDLESLKFEDITVGWLKDFESMLRRDGLSVNAIARHLREIRAVYNDAIDYEVVSLASYPFRRFKIRHEKTAKRSLTVDRLRALRDYPCTEAQRQYRDIFMLIFYLGGINLIDLFGLTEVADGRIEYTRSKTGVPVSLLVQPEALAIIERYRGVNHLLSHADRYRNHEDFTRRLNRALQAIGAPEAVKPNRSKPGPARIDTKKGAFPGITSYAARHTCATLMAELDIPDATIDRVLAHAARVKQYDTVSLIPDRVDYCLRVLRDVHFEPSPQTIALTSSKKVAIL